MPEDVIKGKIVFEGGGALGKAGTSVAGSGSGSGSGFAQQAGGEAVGHLVTQGKSMAKIAKSSLGKLGLIAGAVMAVAKASPQLGATLKILFKSLMLALRPFLDIMSMLIRPFAILMLRLFIPILRKWKNIAPAVKEGVDITWDALGKAGGELKEGKPLESVKTIAKGVIDFWSYVLTPLKDSVVSLFTSMWGSIKEVWSGLVEWFSENIITPIKDAWNEVVSFVKDNVITPIIDGWLNVWNLVKENVITPIKNAWLAVWTFVSEKFIEPVKKAFLGVYKYIDEKVIGPIKTAWQTFMDFMQTYIFDPLNSALSTLKGWIDGIRSAIRNALSMIPGFQTGGYVGETGMYQLHQGETVIPAHMQGMTMNSSPNITINANINSDMDLQALADRLSGIMMESLQRRNSYTFT